VIVPDLLREELALVLCGTAPSRVSKEAQAYYAHPGNIFWKTLFDVGLTPRLVSPKDYPALLEWNIGLTDLNKTEWGADSELSHAAFDVIAFSEKMRRYKPRVIAFDSKFAASKFFGRKTISYGLQPETLFDSALFVVPSTSGRARNYFEIKHWWALADLVRGFL
jgi:TDG/mug DNA glycosylase family protein